MGLRRTYFFCSRIPTRWTKLCLISIRNHRPQNHLHPSALSRIRRIFRSSLTVPVLVMLTRVFPVLVFPVVWRDAKLGIHYSGFRYSWTRCEEDNFHHKDIVVGETGISVSDGWFESALIHTNPFIDHTRWQKPQPVLRENRFCEMCLVRGNEDDYH